MTELDSRIRNVFGTADPISLDEVKNRADRPRGAARKPRRRTSKRTSTRFVAVFGACALIAAIAVVADTRHRRSHLEVSVGDPGPTRNVGGAVVGLGGTTHTLPRTPLPGRSSATAVWTGTQMLIWGGSGQGGVPRNDGASYTPATGRWKMLPKSPLRARADPFYAWTGHEMIVWGGDTVVGQRAVSVTDGAAYDPTTGKWTMLPAAPHSLGGGQSEVWTGSEMIVVLADRTTTVAAAYSPASNRWQRVAAPPAALTNAAPNTPEAVWTGHQAVFLMQNNDDFRNGQLLGAYDPKRNTWSKSPTGHVPDGTVPYLVWDGRDILLLGTSAWNPTTRKWSTLPDAPTGDVTDLYSGQNVIWTGKLVLLWGPTPTPLAFNPTDDQWATFNGGTHPFRNFSQVVWTGRALLGWGGQYNNDANREYDTGIAYQPPQQAAA